MEVELTALPRPLESFQWAAGAGRDLPGLGLVTSQQRFSKNLQEVGTCMFKSHIKIEEL